MTESIVHVQVCSDQSKLHVRDTVQRSAPFQCALFAKHTLFKSAAKMMCQRRFVLFLVVVKLLKHVACKRVRLISSKQAGSKAQVDSEH